MSTASELIRGLDFFRPLDERIIDRIARLCIHRVFAAGDYIVRQGDPGLGLFFITAGSARVEMTMQGMVMPVAVLQAGELVGELSIIDNKPRSASVICLTDATCLLLPRDSFLSMLRKYPEISFQMTKALAARLRSTDERMWQGRTPVAAAPLQQEAGPDRPVETTPVSEAQRVKNMMAESVGWIYLMKPLTRISLAVVGCPVAVSLETQAMDARIATIGNVKLVLFPSGENHVIGVHPYADGNCSSTVLTCNSNRVAISRFAGPVRKGESAWLRVSGGGGVRFDAPAPRQRAWTRYFAAPDRDHSGIRELERALDF